MAADRLSLANALAEARIDRPAAERIATEIFEAIHDSVATKGDLEHLETALKTDLEHLETALKADIERLEAASSADVQRVESRIEIVRAELKADIQRVEARLDGVRNETVIRLGGLMVVPLGLLFAALRYLPPVH